MSLALGILGAATLVAVVVEAMASIDAWANEIDDMEGKDGRNGSD